MLARLTTYSLFGIEAQPVEVEVDISPGPCRKRSSSAWPRRPSKRAPAHRAGAGQQRLSAAHRPDRHQSLAGRSCPKRPRRSTCRSRSGCSAPAASSLPPGLRRMRQRANWPSTVRSGRPRASCRWPWPPASRAMRGLIVPAAERAKRGPSSRGSSHRRRLAGRGRRFLHRTTRHSADPIPMGDRPGTLRQLRTRLCRRQRPGIGQAGRHRRRGRLASSLDDRIARAREKRCSPSDWGRFCPISLPEESIETTRMYSAVGRLAPNQSLMFLRPFRAPHHTISEAGLVGGGSTPAPGEICLAHHGVLVPRRIPGIQSPHARSAPSAPRGKPRHHLAGDGQRDFSGQPDARGRDESLPLRLPRRSRAAVQLHAAANRTVSEPHQRPAARTASISMSRCRRSLSANCRTPAAGTTSAANARASRGRPATGKPIVSRPRADESQRQDDPAGNPQTLPPRPRRRVAS